MLLNGSIVGVHRNADRLVRAFRRLRRAGEIGEFVSIMADGPTVHIASDGGRVCRPLIICDAGVPRVTAEHTAKARRLAGVSPAGVRAGGDARTRLSAAGPPHELRRSRIVLRRSCRVLALRQSRVRQGQHNVLACVGIRLPAREGR